MKALRRVLEQDLQLEQDALKPMKKVVNNFVDNVRSTNIFSYPEFDSNKSNLYAVIDQSKIQATGRGGHTRKEEQLPTRRKRGEERQRFDKAIH